MAASDASSAPALLPGRFFADPLLGPLIRRFVLRGTALEMFLSLMMFYLGACILSWFDTFGVRVLGNQLSHVWGPGAMAHLWVAPLMPEAGWTAIFLGLWMFQNVRRIVPAEVELAPGFERRVHEALILCAVAFPFVYAAAVLTGATFWWVTAMVKLSDAVSPRSFFIDALPNALERLWRVSASPLVRQTGTLLYLLARTALIWAMALTLASILLRTRYSWHFVLKGMAAVFLLTLMHSAANYALFRAVEPTLAGQPRENVILLRAVHYFCTTLLVSGLWMRVSLRRLRRAEA